MKKLFVCCISLVLLLCRGVSADAEEEIPDAVLDMVGDSAVLSSAHWEEAGEETWFVLGQVSDAGKTLYCFMKEDVLWQEAFRTDQVFLPEKGRVMLYMTESAWSLTNDPDDQYLEGPILLILQYGQDQASVERLLAFQYIAGKSWQLIQLNDYPSGTSLRIQEDTVTYYTAVDKAQLVAECSVPCLFARELCTFSLSEVPLSFQQTQKLMD